MIHRYARPLLIALLLIVTAGRLSAQGDFWSPTEGPLGADIRALAIDSHGRAFAGLFSVGLFRSIDNGATWTDASSGLGDLNILALATDSADNILAGTATAGIYRSTDNGGTWNPANVGLVSSTVYDIAFDRLGRVLLGTNQGVFASSTGDVVWQRIGEGLPRSDAQQVVIDSGGRIFVAIAGQGVYRSTDSGASFAQSSTGLGNSPYLYALAVAPDGTLYAANGAFGLYRSTDHGVSWERVGIGRLSKSIGALLIDPLGIVYAGSLFDSTGTVYRSTDRGESWSRIDTGMTSQNIRALAMNRSGELLAGTSSGAFRLDAAQKGWAEINNGLRATSVIALATTPSGDLLAGSVSGGIHRSSDNGASWRRSGMGINDIYGIQALVVGHDGDLFAGTSSGIYRSTDDGLHWFRNQSGTSGESSLGTANVPSLAVDSSGALLAAVPGQGVLRSTNNGASWKLVQGPDVLANPFTVSAVAVDSVGRFLAGTAEGNVYGYPDSAGNWYLLDSMTRAGIAVRSLAVDGHGRIFAATATGIYRWTDSTTGWTRRDTGVLHPDFYAVLVNPSGYIYAGGQSGVYRSIDSGVSFVSTGEGLPGFPVRALTIGTGDILFAGTGGRGVYRGAGRSGVEGSTRQAGASALLEGNIPNPFTSSTRIGFSLPAAEHVRLLLHDLNGRAIALLADGIMSAGEHEVVVERGTLPAGVYLYTLEAGGCRSSRTMVVLR